MFQSLIGNLQTEEYHIHEVELNRIWFQSLIGNLQTLVNQFLRQLLPVLFQSLIGNLQTKYRMLFSTSASKFQSLIGNLQTVLVTG